MKHFIAALSFVFFVTSFGQVENFRFKKQLAENPDQVFPVALANKGNAYIQRLTENKIPIKYITKEYIYINASASQLTAWHKSGVVESFVFEFAPGTTMNDSSRVSTGVQNVHDGLGGLPAGYTGKDVIIAYVDQGLDFRHGDFKDANGHTRVLRYWDQGFSNPTSSPQPYGYGQIWDSTQIENGVCTSNEETTAHGTTVAGVGSGNGLENGHNKGMAPDSKIIIVETNFNTPNWTMTVADACDYVFKVADTLGLPAVVNLSLGSYLGSHDARDPAGVKINQLLTEKEGRIVVSAAGNSGPWNAYHVRSEFNADTVFTWFENNSNAQFGSNTIYFDLWADSADFANARFGFGADRPAPNYGLAGHTVFHDGFENLVNPILDTIWNAAGNRIATIQIFTSIENGNYHMEGFFSNVDSTAYLYRFSTFSTTGASRYDLWTSLDLGLNKIVSSVPTVAQYPAIANYQSPDKLQSIVSSWNCSDKVVTVGNMVNRSGYTNFLGTTFGSSPGQTSGFLHTGSSKGPSRLNVVKPDITAPGATSFAASPLWLINNASYHSLLDQYGKHAKNGGTSMACPVISGVAALYLEKCNSMTHADFIASLHTNAKVDAMTGVTPNFNYGYGKIDAVKTLLNAIEIQGSDYFCPEGTVLSVDDSEHTIQSILWSTNETTNSIQVASAGIYTCTVNYDGNCTSKGTKTLTQGAVLPAPALSLNGNVFSASTSPNYQWYLNGTVIPGATSQEYTATVGGVYTVSTTSVDGCISTSQSISNVGLSELMKGFAVYPNPTEGIIHILGLEEADLIQVLDVQGRKVAFQRSEAVLDLKNTSSGMYFIHIQRGNESGVIKIQRK